MPIELVWHEMKDYVRSKFCKTIEDLEFYVQDFGRKLSVEKCQQYILKRQEVKKRLV